VADAATLEAGLGDLIHALLEGNVVTKSRIGEVVIGPTRRRDTE
jgi:hypothetical protein